MPALLRTIRGLENSALTSLLIYNIRYIYYYSASFLSTNIIALIGTVLYNAIKEYYNNRIRKIIYFYSYTIEKDYNCAEKREDNILTIDKCRISYSNKKDIEANKREKKYIIYCLESFIKLITL
ncbi:hypothetical protein HBI84_243900 [Parastagonospora nodorum]|nr:hypothetical protein HBI84_243900 [Parastagonospora nodorum]